MYRPNRSFTTSSASAQLASYIDTNANAGKSRQLLPHHPHATIQAEQDATDPVTYQHYVLQRHVV